MATFYKCIVVDRRRYYKNAHGGKEYLTGEKENDETLIAAALITGEEIDYNDTLNEAFGITPEEADIAAKAYVCVNFEKFQKEGIKFGISVPQKVEAEMNIDDLVKKFPKKA
jgi:hypothetical protein